MEKPLGYHFQVRSSYYQAAQCNQKTPIPVSSRWLVRSGKAKSPKLLKTDLTMKPDLVLTNPIGKDGVVDVIKSLCNNNTILSNNFYKRYHHGYLKGSDYTYGLF